MHCRRARHLQSVADRARRPDSSPVHIWEYDGYSGFDRAHPAIRESAEWAKYESTVLPLVASRSSRICQEFAFWPTAEPSVSEGQPIFEMRTYNLVR